MAVQKDDGRPWPGSRGCFDKVFDPSVGIVRVWNGRRCCCGGRRARRQQEIPSAQQGTGSNDACRSPYFQRAGRRAPQQPVEAGAISSRDAGPSRAPPARVRHSVHDGRTRGVVPGVPVPPSTRACGRHASERWLSHFTPAFHSPRWRVRMSHHASELFRIFVGDGRATSPRGDTRSGAAAASWVVSTCTGRAAASRWRVADAAAVLRSRRAILGDCCPARTCAPTGLARPDHHRHRRRRLWHGALAGRRVPRCRLQLGACRTHRRRVRRLHRLGRVGRAACARWTSGRTRTEDRACRRRRGGSRPDRVRLLRRRGLRWRVLKAPAL